jgi:site-specific recombinase XerD
MYQSGKVDIRVLKDVLGHEQLNTTQIYTHVVSQNLEAAMGFNPLSEIKRQDD